MLPLRRSFSRFELAGFRRLLCTLQRDIRAALLAERDRNARRLGLIAAVTAADTIYHVDRASEEAILDWFDRHWPRAWPVQLVMEGLDDQTAVTIPRGLPIERTLLKCILDPIDGTRAFMYDKRSGWILAGLAPQRGSATHLGDICVAAMTELPTTKQARADQLSAIHGGGVVAEGDDLIRGRTAPLRIRPSSARNFKHGFASFARFFTIGKTLTSRIEEAFWRQLHGTRRETSPLVFDDQYISTGGQLAELLAGHDRMVADLRPLVFQKLRQPSALVCHPYDICTELILREAGGIVESPAGRPLRAPLDTTTPVAWVGFANATLARLARPALRRTLRRYL